MQHYQNWEVVRIPHFEWEKLPRHPQARSDYLLRKLKQYPQLFNQAALERLAELEKMGKKSAAIAPLSTGLAESDAKKACAQGIFKVTEPPMPVPIEQLKETDTLAKPSAPESRLA